MENIFNQYYPLWFSIASKYTGNYHDSEELVEEALAAYLQLYNHNISNPKAYIAKTIYHLYIDKIRRQKQKHVYDKYIKQSNTAATETESSIERNAEVRQSLAKMYYLLSAQERAIFILKKAFEYEYDKIESIFGISYENCRQLMRRAKDKMQRKTQQVYSENIGAAAFIDAFFKASKYSQFETLIVYLKKEITQKKNPAKVVKLTPLICQFGLSA